MKIFEKLKNALNRPEELNPTELEFLTYVEGKTFDITTYSQSFHYKTDLNYRKTMDKFMNGEYIRIATPYESLNSLKLQELKNILKENGLSINGNKDSLIQRIQENISEISLKKYILEQYVALTEKGKQFIGRHNENSLFTRKEQINNLVVALKNNDVSTFIKLLENTGTSSNPYALPYDASAIQKDFSCLQQYLKDFMPTDNDLGIAIYTFTSHCAEKDLINNLRECGFDLSATPIRKVYTILISYRNLNEFIESGVTKYQIRTAGDSRVCANCKKHDKKIYKIQDAKFGENLPPFCDECRCIILPIFNK